MKLNCLAWTLLALLALPLSSQISVTGGSGANKFGTSGDGTSGDVSNTGDVLLANDLELGGELYLNRKLYMKASSSAGADGDQSIFFYDANSRENEYLRWFESGDEFLLSDDLRLEGNNLVGDGDLNLESVSFYQLYTARETVAGGPFFNWRGRNAAGTLDTLMTLVGSVGNLRLKGTLSENDIDLAENFWMEEAVEPGELVAADEWAGSIRRARRGDQGALLGVVSTRPGTLLGGAPFTRARLEQVWGAEIGSRFAEASLRYRNKVLEQPYSRQRAEELASLDAFWRSRAARLRSVTARRTIGQEGDGQGNVSRAPAVGDEEHLPAEWQSERQAFEEHLERQAIEAFFDDHFAPVALAGRVPVRADASNGPISVGDPLTIGQRPGRAVRASEPGWVVGTALEPLAAGEGVVLAFVQRAWYGGTGDSKTTSHEFEGGESPSRPLSASLGETPRGAVGVTCAPGQDLRSPAHGVAEFHLSREPVAVGEVVVADRESPGLLAPGRIAGDPAVVGIVAGLPGVLLGENLAVVEDARPELAAALASARATGNRAEQLRLWAELRRDFEKIHVPVAISGTVAALADAGYGSIRVGDLLSVSPTRGHLMRTEDPAPGTVVAKALASLERGRGEIRVLVMLR